MPMTAKTTFWMLCGFHFLTTSQGLKDCMEPIRASLKDELTCSPEFALVPEKICHYEDEECPMANEGSDVCAVVAEALFAEWRMMDGALLRSGSCRASIEQGRFSAQEAMRVLPDSEELVGVRVSGREWIQALEQSLAQYYIHGDQTAYPHTAGLRYELDLLKEPGQRIRNAQVLDFMCHWKPLQENESYMVLTDAALAKTLFPKGTPSGTGRSVAESFFLYATSVCTVKNNWHKLRLKLAPSLPESRRYPLSVTMSSSPPSPSPRKKTQTITATI